MEFSHVPVMLNETIEMLKIKANGIYVDGTVGGAGHASKICEKLNKEGMFIGIDQDTDALSYSKKILEKYTSTKHLIHENYKNLKNTLNLLQIEKVDGILIDIGVSSYQIDSENRGFSYMRNARLDMRMNQDAEFSADDVINHYQEKKLVEILYKYGEEPFAKKIAHNIVIAREDKKIETTFELVDIIEKSIPKKYRQEGHVAKKTFQAIRIEVNNELEILENAIEEMINVLSVGGRLCIITFHSLEDRIVKEKFRRAVNTCVCPRELPVCVCGNKPQGQIVTQKPIIPSEKELLQNSRARSAKLRVFEKK